MIDVETLILIPTVILIHLKSQENQVRTFSLFIPSKKLKIKKLFLIANIDEAKENQVHNIFNDHIIVTENLETLERIKIEPSDEDSTIRCIENRTSDKTRYSFESGIDINNLADRQSLQFSPRVQNSFRDDIVANIKNNHKYL